MKLPERINREYRILAIAIVFFLAGAIFFWYDSSTSPLASKSPGIIPSQSQGISVQPPIGQGEQESDPDFAKFPPPTQFSTFAYTVSGLNGSSTFPIRTTCTAAYVAILIFPATIDYRSDINAAVYNQAFPCTAHQKFTIAIATSDIATAHFGGYYFIIADQGKTGTWYNPR